MARIHVTIQKACDAVGKGNLDGAKQIINSEYPFVPLTNSGRKYSEYQKTIIFLRDGFIDRYSGEKMVFPPVLRLLSNLMPEEFPFQKNWKMSDCHLAYWKLLPTVDHVVPVSRGGRDEESNWVCASQLRNSAKSNWLLEELGWSLCPPGNLHEWDGMLAWFMAYTQRNQEVLEDQYLNKWHRAAEKACNRSDAVAKTQLV